jgi:hypothetical protein
VQAKTSAAFVTPAKRKLVPGSQPSARPGRPPAAHMFLNLMRAIDAVESINHEEGSDDIHDDGSSSEEDAASSSEEDAASSSEEDNDDPNDSDFSGR